MDKRILNQSWNHSTQQCGGEEVQINLGVHIDSIHFDSLIDALNKTKNLGANILQIYMGNKKLTTLREKIKLTREEITIIKIFLTENKIKLVIHAILTLNYCNDPYSKRNQWGLDNLIYDINLCNKIGGIGVIIHMGTHKTTKINISYDECINNFINSIKIVLDKTKKIPIILETPVNRKNIVGGTIEGLAKLYNSIPDDYKKRVKICVDTQHIFASGYNIRTVEGMKQYFDNVDKLIGIKNLYVIHLNDSAKEFDSRINRHATIGQGFIFSNSKESLLFLLQFAKKHKIPLLLETVYDNYGKEIKLLKELIKSPSTSNSISQIGSAKNIKNVIIKIFTELLEYYETLGKKGNISTRYRIDSYIKALNTLKGFNKPIYDANDVKDLPSIGKGFCEKINEIAKYGTLQIYENIQKNNGIKEIKAVTLFQNVWGIGVEFARKLVDKNIFTIKDLKNAVKDKKIKLTKQQLIGLKYYDDLNKKIPREEIVYYKNLIKKLVENNNIRVHNAGSYRSGKSTSGDIDLIISTKIIKKESIENIKKIFYNALKNNNLIEEILVSGPTKSIYIIKDNHVRKSGSNMMKKSQMSFFRKLDVLYVDEKLLPWYLLYFGTSREFSKKIRAKASKMGYKLSEKGLFNKESGVRINFEPKNENEILKYLGEIQ